MEDVGVKRKVRRKEFWAKKYKTSEKEDEQYPTAAEQSVPREKQRKEGSTDMTSNDADGTPAKRRYLLFVGNMAYGTNRDHIYKHFGRFPGLKDVRMMTDRVTGKFKGTAFVEYEDREGHGRALGLHQSKLCGRIINVELTVGGGGNCESRKTKLKAKNAQHLGTGGPNSVNAMPLGKTRVVGGDVEAGVKRSVDSSAGTIGSRATPVSPTVVGDATAPLNAKARRALKRAANKL